MKVLEISNIVKSYNKNIVLDNITFSINSGEIIGLIGKNGAGKSTLMKIIVGLLKPENGYVKICDFDIDKNRENALEHVSVIIEGPSLYEDLTVKQHLKLNAYLRNIDIKQLEYSYKYLEFEKDLSKKISKLSVGMKQEVGLAICFMNDVELYILDEPINGLDFDNVLKFRKKVEELKLQGKSFLISSHLLKELEIVADRYLFLKEGSITEVAKKENSDIEKIYREKIYYE